ncbi:MAG: hypothetical protein ABL923_07400 [Burkholderiaceae bacterium]
MKKQLVIKLGLTAVLLGQLFGCAVPTKGVQTRAPAVVQTPQSTSSAPVVSQEAALDKNEVIIDKPAPVETEVVSLLAKITPAQLARLNQALKVASDEVKSVSTVSQATPKIRAFVERLSCIRQYNDGGSNVLQNMAAPGVSFKFFVPPMHGTKVHNKNSCLTVSAIALKPLSYQGLAGIQIKVSYVAEDSGETTTSNHEINKNNKGVWWFTR